MERRATFADDRGDVENVSAALGHHHRRNDLAAEKYAEEINVEDLPHLGFGYIGNCTELAETGIVYHYINPGEFADSSIDEFLDLRQFSYVGWLNEGFGAKLIASICQGLQAVDPSGGQRQVIAFFGQRKGRLCPDPAGCAGNYCCWFGVDGISNRLFKLVSCLIENPISYCSRIICQARPARDTTSVSQSNCFTRPTSWSIGPRPKPEVPRAKM